MSEISTTANSNAPVRPDSWFDVLRAFAHPRVITMLFLGFSAGLPLFLIFSSLSLWLREAGVERSVVTLFSWAALGYSFKFVWAPLVDTLPIPGLTRALGRRRSWMLLAQFLVIIAIAAIAFQDPGLGGSSVTLMALGAVMLGFSSATQDIVIDAYRIECAEPRLQALLSSSYIAGYRVGMLVSGAGALFLATAMGSVEGAYQYEAWRQTYLVMAACMLVGVATVLLIPEPQSQAQRAAPGFGEASRIVFLFVCCVLVFIFHYAGTAGLAGEFKAAVAGATGNRALAGITVELLRLSTGLLLAALTARIIAMTPLVDMALVRRLYLEPVQEFFSRYGLRTAALLLGLICLYRISDIVLGVIANIFYYDLGYSKNEIASVSKVFGLIATLVGGFVGGALALRYGVLRILLIGAVLSALTNLLFILLANIGYDPAYLYVVIGADNLCAGLASAAFVAFLSSLTHVRFTAMQYAIFSSIMTLLPKTLGGYSGAMVDSIGYSSFFLFTAAIGIPVILLIMAISRNPRFSQTAQAAQSS